MRTLLSFVYLLHFSVFVTSQNSDSTIVRLNKVLKNSTSDFLRVETLIKMGESQLDKEYHYAEQYFLDAQDLMNASSYQQKEAHKAKVNFLMGVLHKKEENFPLALNYFLNSLSYYKSVNEVSNLSNTYSQIAECYQNSKENNSAILNYKRSIELKEKLGDIHGLAISYYRMGISYVRLTYRDSAMTSYIRAKELFTRVNDEKKVHKVKHRIARVLLKEGLYNDAEKILLENLEFYKKRKDKHGECTAEYDISLLYRELITSNSSTDYDKGIYHAQNALLIAKENRFPNKIAKSYKLKAFFYMQKGDYEKAYKNYRNYDLQNLKIFNEKEAKKINGIKMHYQFREERKELELKAEAERSLRILYVTLFIITLTCSIVIGIFARKNFLNKAKIASQKLEKEKIQRELLKQKIKASEAEIKFLISDNSMKVLSKKELLQQLKEEEQLTSSEHIKRFVRSLIYKIQQQINTEDKLLTIQNRIEEVDKGFDSKIRSLYPNLTKNEREVCILLRLNLSIKEIVSIKNTTIDSIKSIRYRIRKKIGLNPGEELEKKIQDL